MSAFYTKFMTLVGGKRGLSVIVSGVVTILVTTGKITPQTAEIIGGVAGALGFVGIVHSNMKSPLPGSDTAGA